MHHWLSVDLDDSDYVSTDDEPMGTKEKYWVEDPDGTAWLFKIARESEGSVRGEDWAEWCSFLIADLLGIPVARVQPASWQGRRGSLSRSILNRDSRLVHGNELMQRSNPEYDGSVTRHNPNYTVQGVRSALDSVGPPRIYEWSNVRDGFDAWVLYVCLDALVAGRDRHHQNWAAVEHAGDLTLSPSFDHGNSLAFQESPSRVESLLSSPGGVERWAHKGRSHHFAGKPTLVEVALESLELVSPQLQVEVQQRITALDLNQIELSLRSIPGEIMSDAHATFVIQLLEVNQRRLQLGCQAHRTQ